MDSFVAAYRNEARAIRPAVVVPSPKWLLGRAVLAENLTTSICCLGCTGSGADHCTYHGAELRRRADDAIMTTQTTSSSGNILGHGAACERSTKPGGDVPQMRLPMGTRSAKLDVAMTNGRKGLFALVSIDRDEILIDLNGENTFLSPTKRSLQIGERKHVFGRDETVGFVNTVANPTAFLIRAACA